MGDSGRRGEVGWEAGPPPGWWRGRGGVPTGLAQLELTAEEEGREEVSPSRRLLRLLLDSLDL
jgi:hypothetical protein